MLFSAHVIIIIRQQNGDLGYYITSVDDFSRTLIGGAAQNITLNSKITLEQYTRILFLNYPGSNDGALLAIAPGNKIITAFRNNGVWEEESSHFIATKSDLANMYYKIGSSATNNPLETIKQNWDDMPDGYYFCEISCGSAYIGIVQRISNGKHGSVFVNGYGDNTPIYVKRLDGVWK